MEQPVSKEIKFDQIIKEIPTTAISVITNPVGFFQRMPKTGGFLEPLIFTVAMGVVTGVLNVILSIFHLSYAGSFGMALFSIILAPIFIGVFSFIGGGILFIIWKIMGSQESYETAYRCGAYVAAISPITTILNIIPYAGSAISLLWTAFLLVIASSEVHDIKRKTAWIVFGIIFVIFLIMSISSQYAARKMANRMVEFQQDMQKRMQDLSPEEQRKMAEDFIKRMQEQNAR